MTIQFAALPTIPTRSGDSGPGEQCRAVPISRPAPIPSDDWLEAARQEFCRRWQAENGDTIDDCNQVYGD